MNPHPQHSGHTPAPWRRDKHNVNLITAETANVKGMGVTICDVTNSHMDVTQDANARLIVASPLLLEACKDLLAMMDEGLLVRDTSKDHEDRWAMNAMEFVSRLAKAQEAIALATQEAKVGK